MIGPKITVQVLKKLFASQKDYLDYINKKGKWYENNTELIPFV